LPPRSCAYYSPRRWTDASTTNIATTTKANRSETSATSFDRTRGARSVFPRRGQASGACMPPLASRGWRAERRKILWLRIRLDAAGTFRRATCGQFISAGPRFRRVCPASDPFVPFGFPYSAPRAVEKGRSDAFGVDRTVVSQLLPGLRSEPGRSPGAARVLPCERSPQAPHPVPPHERLATRPSVDEVVRSVSEV
jgi:hypothetical protein